MSTFMESGTGKGLVQKGLNMTTRTSFQLTATSLGAKAQLHFHDKCDEIIETFQFPEGDCVGKTCSVHIH